MKAFFRHTLPSGAFVGLLALIYGLSELAACLTTNGFHLENLPAGIWPSSILLVIAALGFGAFRVLAFHPLCNRAYAQWLMTSPWTPGKPLPAGPLLPTLIDIVSVVVLAGLAARHSQADALIVAMAFMGGVAIAATLVFALAYMWFSTYLMAFGLGLFLLYRGQIGVMFTVAAVFVVISWVALQQSLRRVPWDRALVGRELSAVLSKPIGQRPTGRYFYVLSASYLVKPFSVLHGIMLSLLAGWWTFAIGRPQSTQELLDMWAMVSVLCAFLCFGRLGVYYAQHWPPISLLGRLLTLRWIVPRYDYAAVPSIAAMAAVAFLPRWLHSCGLPLVDGLGIGVAVCFLIVLLAPPSLATWRATGAHRVPNPRIPLQQGLRG